MWWTLIQYSTENRSPTSLIVHHTHHFVETALPLMGKEEIVGHVEQWRKG